MFSAQVRNVTFVCMVFNYHAYARFTSRSVKSHTNAPQSIVWCMDGLAQFAKDAVWFHRNLFSIDSAKICTAATPLYLTARWIDNPIQEIFYDPCLHKNIHQIPSNVVFCIEKTVSASVFAIASLSLIVPNKRFRTTSRLFAIGLISGLYLKDFAKKAKTHANIRPWHEQFSSEKRSYGGFPSGHMFEITCMTVVFGLEYGLKAWLPLGIISAAMALASVTSNRHYTSQVVAGSALGIVYGIAAYKRIDQLQSRTLAFSINSDRNGVPALTCSYAF